MQRAEFERLITEDRKAAMTWLAGQMFDTHDLESLKDTWVQFFTGEITLQPLTFWKPEVLMQIADETVSWDEEVEGSKWDSEKNVE